MDKSCLCSSQLLPTCYVCQYCFKLFHKRCVMKNKKKFNIIKNHVVICSDCNDKNKSSNCQEWEKILLEQTIEELTIETEAKGKQLERVIFDKDTTLQEAIKTEEELNEVIRQQEKTLQAHLSKIRELEALIKSHKKNMMSKETQTTTRYRSAKTQTDKNVKTTETQCCEDNNLQDTAISYKKELENKCQLIISLEDRIDELEEMCRKMVDSMRVLEQENIRCCDELHIIRKELDESTPEKIIPVRKTSVDDTIKETNNKKPVSQNKKILILCDQFGYNVGQKIKNKLNANVLSVVKPFACYEDVIVNLPLMTCDFTRNDSVIIIAGFNDFIRGGFPSLVNFNNKLKSCLHTNLHIVSVPYMKNTNINRLIYKFNYKLNDYILKVNKCTESSIHFIDFNSKFGRLTKGQLVLSLLNSLRYPSHNNIKFIPLNEKTNFQMESNRAVIM